jgi:hypothetical protein
MKEIWLSPSDLSYFWSDSKIGFYDKYVLEIQRPKQAFPSVFNTIDLCMKDAFEKITCTDIVSGAPDGHITHDDIYVQSKLIDLGNYKVGFKGKIDCLLDRKNGKYFVVDYKTTHISEKLKSIYCLQLMAYAYALENPLNGEAKKIEGLGLIAFQPKKFDFSLNSGNLSGELAWIPVSFDKLKFKSWITDELKPLINGTREEIFESGTDKSWSRYISCFEVEDVEEENAK